MVDTQRLPIRRVVLHTDGASRGNPGISGIGFTLIADDGQEFETLCAGGAFIGIATNNQAEYQALIWGLRNALALEELVLDICADSELLVKQLNREYKVKNEGIRPLFFEALYLLGQFERYTLRHVMREENTEADELANLAMDERDMVGSYRLPYSSRELFADPDERGGAYPRKHGPGEGGYGAQTAAGGSGTLHVLSGSGVQNVAGGSGAQNGAGGSGAQNVVGGSGAASSPAPSPKPSPTTQVRGLRIPEVVGASEALTGASDASAGAATVASSTSAPAFSPSVFQGKGTPVYTLTIKDHFDAAHALIGYPGECKDLHGHTWDVEVSVCGTELDEVGIVYDFKSLKNDLAAILCDYDHKYLNEVPPFDVMNATAENLAREVYEQLQIILPAHIRLKEVAVWESPIARLAYSEVACTEAAYSEAGSSE